MSLKSHSGMLTKVPEEMGLMPDRTDAPRLIATQILTSGFKPVTTWEFESLAMEIDLSSRMMSVILGLVDDYVTRLELGQINADLEAPYVEELGGRILSRLIMNESALRSAMGFFVMQDISNGLNLVSSSSFSYAGDVVGPILGYRSDGHRVGSLLARIASIQRSLIRPSSEISKVSEYIFTCLRELSTLLEALSSTFVDNLVTQGPSVTYAVVVSAVVLLCFVYQYLLGYVDRGGSKADSSGSLEFRDTYISIVLFLGAYIWIKSRDVASKTVPETAIKEHAMLTRDGIIKKYESRFKPRKENGVEFQRISSKRYPTRNQAVVVYQTAISCYEYGKDYGPQVDLGDGRSFTIPAMSEEEQRCSGPEKVNMVKARTERVLKAFIDSEAARNPPPALPEADLAQQLPPDSEGDQVSGRIALLQLPGNQNSELLQDFSMEVFEPPCDDSQVLHQSVEDLTSRVSQLEGQVSELQSQNDELSRQKSQLEGVVSEFQHLRQHVEELKRQYSQLQHLQQRESEMLPETGDAPCQGVDIEELWQQLIVNEMVPELA